jgi:hypothetical protein
LKRYTSLFFIEIGSRRVCLGGITRHRDSVWTQQVARNATMQETGYLNGRQVCYTSGTRGSVGSSRLRWLREV